MSPPQYINGLASRVACAHSVQFYGADESRLAATVGAYIAEGLKKGESVLVIASPEHTAEFLRRLEYSGGDPGRSVRERRVLFLDAGTMLAGFMVNGEPDQHLFREAIQSALNELHACDAATDSRAYGEMVGVLWERGEYSAAIRLEELWNDLLASAKIQLFCGYPIDIFGSEVHSHEVARVLSTHTHLLPTGQDGDVERALQHAMEDLAPDSLACLVHAPATRGASMPKAETAILALGADLPEHASGVLTRARRYYENEKRFRALIDHSPDAILLTNREGEVHYASASTSRVLHCDASGIVGRTCFDLVHPADRERARRALTAALAKARQPVIFEARTQSSGAQSSWVESTVTDLSDEPGVNAIVWNCRDITDRKAAEEALRESERRLAARERYLQTLLDSMPECVKVLGRHGEVLEMNGAGLRMLEADAANQVVGKCVYPLIDKTDRPAFQALNESVFEGGAGGKLEFSVTSLKGSQRTFETYVVPLHDQEDSVIGALSATRDVTERNAVIAALRHANESLEQFAYAAAHDLQEPIRNVALYTQLLQQHYSDKLDERANEFMSVTVEGARRMQTLIRDLLAYTRSLDRPADQEAIADAGQLVAEVLANLRTSIKAARAEIVCSDLPALPVYRAHLVQLLQNLVSNALKYRSGRPLKILISAAEQPEEFTVTVSDNGIGIPHDQRERIFGVFKRLHNRSIPGNGIGLAICQRIISHYHGRIWVESNADGGSTFAFTLPRRQAPATR